MVFFCHVQVINLLIVLLIALHAAAAASEPQNEDELCVHELWDLLTSCLASSTLKNIFDFSQNDFLWILYDLGNSQRLTKKEHAKR